MIKAFKTVDVLQTFTGFVLEEGGFRGIHEVMDHFYPGIMTLGCAAMAKPAAEEIARQHPELQPLCAKLGEINKDNVDSWREAALKELPPTLELRGELSPTDEFIGERFKQVFG